MNKSEIIRLKMQEKYGEPKERVLNPNIRKVISGVQEENNIKMREKKDKIVITFSMDKKIVEELRYHCEKEGMYMSAFVTKTIKKHLETLK